MDTCTLPAVPLYSVLEEEVSLCHHKLLEVIYFYRQDQSPLKQETLMITCFKIPYIAMNCYLDKIRCEHKN